MVVGTIFLGLAACLVLAAIIRHRQSLLFAAVAIYVLLALWLASGNLALLLPALLLAIGLELYGLSRVLTGGLTSEGEQDVRAKSNHKHHTNHNSHRPA